MTQSAWTQIDAFYSSRLLPPDPILDQALADCRAANLPAIAVSPLQGQFLHLLARLLSATRILEIGTLGGYSAICLARALPPTGTLITLELNPLHAAIAAANIARAALQDKVEIKIGKALDLLPTLAPQAPFDLIFIDADKPSNADYLAWALRLARPGTAIVIDNVVRQGAILDQHSKDPDVQGTRRLADALAHHPRLSATALQTVGLKGHDGFILAIVNEQNP
jgi:predicted O-methyltransferase YrrM